MNPTLVRAFRLRCPQCGEGRLFRGLFQMNESCSACGASFKREQGFYLGSIYINYGATVIGTGGLYALLVLALGWSYKSALAACLVAALVFPIWFFRWARSLLLALDGSVNQQQAVGSDATGGAKALAADDARAGCAMGIALALILLFGLGMAVVTILFTIDAEGGEAAAKTRQRLPRASQPEPVAGIQMMPRDSSSEMTASTHFATGHSCVGSTRSGFTGGS
ncbi:MAG: DUF983 domain-containing protein [Planctomycetota bacterium]|jgi:uncharacterized protein (DUF983 family)